MLFVYDDKCSFIGCYSTLEKFRYKYPRTAISEVNNINSVNYWNYFLYVNINQTQISYYRTVLAIKKYNFLKTEAVDSKNTFYFYQSTKKLKAFIERGKFINPEAFLA